MVARLSSSWTSSTAGWCQVPAVYDHWNTYSWVYSLVLLVAARLAAAPVFMVVLLTWASAYVSGTVTPHSSGLPLDHGRIVMLSGRLSPSCRSRPTGSLTAGILAFFIARRMMSLRCEWRCCLGALSRPTSPWSPHASTTFPQPQCRMCVVRTLCNPVGGQLIS